MHVFYFKFDTRTHTHTYMWGVCVCVWTNLKLMRVTSTKWCVNWFYFSSVFFCVSFLCSGFERRKKLCCEKNWRKKEWKRYKNQITSFIGIFRVKPHEKILYKIFVGGGFGEEKIVRSKKLCLILRIDTRWRCIHVKLATAPLVYYGSFKIRKEIINSPELSTLSIRFSLRSLPA